MVKRVAKKKKKKVDSRIELVQYLTKASISLGAALYHAKKLGETEMATDILKAALAAERIESVAIGKHINRIQEGL